MVRKIDRTLLIKLFCMGHSKTAIAEHFGIDRKTLYRYLKNYPISEEDMPAIKLVNILRKEEKKGKKDNGVKNYESENLPDNWKSMTVKERREYLKQKI